MLTEEEALAKILSRTESLPPRTLAVEQAGGCFLLRDVSARLPLPLFDNSAMDGYAVIASDCTRNKRLRVVGEQPAGVDRGLQVRNGEAVRIFTGAPIPAGADAVVMQEDVIRESDQIAVNTEVEAGEFIRRRGCDLSEGQKILKAGERLGAESLALLAAQGFAEIEVGGLVRAAILSTGDELVPPGKPIEPGQLYESNSVLLRALVVGTGAAPEFVRTVSDDVDRFEGSVIRWADARCVDNQRWSLGGRSRSGSTNLERTRRRN